MWTIKIDGGEKKVPRLAIKKDGVAVNLTGLRSTISIMRDAGDAPLLLLSSDVALGGRLAHVAPLANGLVDVSFEPGDTGPDQSGTLQPGIYRAYYWTDDGAGGSPSHLKEGRVIVNLVGRRTA